MPALSGTYASRRRCSIRIVETQILQLRLWRLHLVFEDLRLSDSLSFRLLSSTARIFFSTTFGHLPRPSRFGPPRAKSFARRVVASDVISTRRRPCTLRRERGIMRWEASHFELARPDCKTAAGRQRLHIEGCLWPTGVTRRCCCSSRSPRSRW